MQELSGAEAGSPLVGAIGASSPTDFDHGGDQSSTSDMLPSSFTVPVVKCQLYPHMIQINAAARQPPSGVWHQDDPTSKWPGSFKAAR